MSRRPRIVTTTLLACALGVPAVALAGCGGGDELPSGAVAEVDGSVITKAQYDAALKLQLTRVSQQITNGALFRSSNPKLVTFTPVSACVATAKASIPSAQRSQVPDATLQQACANVPAGTKASAVQSLISTKVLESEAKDEDVQVSSQEIDQRLNDLYTAEIGGKANLQKFRTLTGLPDSVFRDTIRQALLFQKLQAKAVEKAGKVSDADVRAQYDDNKSRYTEPESRELHVVVTQTEDQANKAKAALEGGAQFATVAQQYSIDAQTKAAGGKLSGVVQGQTDASLDKAAFSTAQGALAGPVQTPSGFVVLRVDKINPGQPVPFERLQAVLRKQLEVKRPQEAAQEWQDGLLKKWKPRTQCAEGYNVVEYCSNQAPQTATTTASVAPPQ
jgi:foldase protein PrsA